MYGAFFRHVAFPLYETHLRGRATLRRLAELERSQWLPPGTLEELGFRRMQDALRFAEERVPFYGRRFAEYGVRARDVHAPEDLARFPILTKAEIRAHGPELVAEGVGAKLYPSGTGGSTGEPVQFMVDHRTYEHRIAAEIRSDRWAGADLGEREAHVWGIPLQKEPVIRRYKRLLHETVLRRRMLCAFDLTDARLREVVEEMSAYAPRVVVGYVNPLYSVARYALARGLPLPRPRGVVATAERLFAHQRELLERAFRAPVFDRYGCREVMLLAAECDRHEGKHVNVENVFVELYRAGKPAPVGETGEVLISDLVNRTMPLLRYKNDDLAIMSPRRCSCGRGLPLLASVEGRVLDMIVGPDGRLLAGEFFPHLFKDHPEIRRFQVHQARDRAITVKLLPGDGFHPGLPRIVEHRLKEFLGERARVAIEVVDDIPVTVGGKHRVTVSEVPIELGAIGS
jgi:phenylacetate-CoA ligase